MNNDNLPYARWNWTREISDMTDRLSVSTSVYGIWSSYFFILSVPNLCCICMFDDDSRAKYMTFALSSRAIQIIHQTHENSWLTLSFSAFKLMLVRWVDSSDLQAFFCGHHVRCFTQNLSSLYMCFPQNLSSLYIYNVFQFIWKTRRRIQTMLFIQYLCRNTRIYLISEELRISQKANGLTLVIIIVHQLNRIWHSSKNKKTESVLYLQTFTNNQRKTTLN